MPEAWQALTSLLLMFLSTRALEIEPRVVRPRWVPVDSGSWIIEIDQELHVLAESNSRLSLVDVNPACRALDGKVVDHESESRALLTRCGASFYGLIIVGEMSLELEPMSDVGEEHLLREIAPGRSKRQASPAKSLYNLRGDTFKQENYGDELVAGEPGSDNELQELHEADDVQSFYDRTWHRDRLPTRKTVEKSLPPKWLELTVAADYSVMGFHGSRAQQYILALLNIVSAIYKDPSLDSNMHLTVVRIIFYPERRDGMVHQGNARRSLENVNKWNRKLLASSNQTHDVAVWLTRLDIGGPSGYAPVSGACDPARSCALNRDEGLTSAFIIAHEVAHILGLSHDGDRNSGNTCSREAARGSIMAPMVAANFHNFHWSPCSRKEFHRKARHWTCLLNRPNNDASKAADDPSEIFSMDEQCRMEFGEGYGRCRSMEPSNLCAHLWCGWANSSQPCKTKRGPPLQATMCAENKWCVNGLCKLINERQSEPSPLAVRSILSENSWSSWSPWGECTRSCGVGVQYRTRQCSGGLCEGESKEVKVCEVVACPSYEDYRAQQCLRFFANDVSRRKNLFDSNGTWLPYEAFDGTPSCQLICYNKETGEVFHTGLNVEDGTPCSYESSDICIGGSCKSMGCDGVLNSGRKRDACGFCDGYNSTCENVNAKFQRKLRRETTRLAVLPEFACNIKVVVTILLADTVPHEGSTRILLRDIRKRRHEVSEFDVDGRAPVIIIEGGAFRIERLEEKYVLWSRGPLMSEIVMSLLATLEAVISGASIMVSTHYVIRRSELHQARGRYAWLLGPAGPCSVSCGGGVRKRALLCRDEIERKFVSKKKCLLASKPSKHREIESCNDASCEYTWIPSMWERCSGSTESSCGRQLRRLYCVRSSFGERLVTRDNELRVFRNTVPPSNCREIPQPPTQRHCSRLVPSCPGLWVYGDWSACNASCGHGMQTRRARCSQQASPNQEIVLDTCDQPLEQNRACRGHLCSACSSQLQHGFSWRKLQEACRSGEFASQCAKPATSRNRCCQICQAGARCSKYGNKSRNCGG
ncbi:hypothetical protein QAD02_003808 [Eretmocerus hayati]|uniref:Uncharacterized protein n=1 Tax=Eretmocerus hayati TaxID=131215 RepID=A0ACC2NMP9_9HYME|nr:hypothetical protein QAD02_003808 [Eretmocerus hayati]